MVYRSLTYINKKGCGVTVAWLLGWHQLQCRQADAMSVSGQLQKSEASLGMSAAGGRAEAIGRKADVGLECRLLEVDRTWRGGG